MKHLPVLLQESIEKLEIKPNDVVLDATLGSAGHAKEICRLIPQGIFIGLDADELAIQRSKLALEEFSCQKNFFVGYFDLLDDAVAQSGLKKIDKVIFDLGLNSEQLENSGRGFSFQKNEPLIMTFSGDSENLTAGEILNSYSEKDLADIFFNYGQERASRKIAKAIFEARKKKRIETTFDLVEIVEKVFPRKSWMKISPATKIFQALRIAVNDELNRLVIALRKSFELLSGGGRIAVISFHSLEDRIVKNFSREIADIGSGKILTKKPIVPNLSEIVSNPRSRSAKLRVLEKNE